MVKISYDQEKTKAINFVMPAIFLAVGIFMIIDGLNCHVRIILAVKFPTAQGAKETLKRWISKS